MKNAWVPRLAVLACIALAGTGCSRDSRVPTEPAPVEPDLNSRVLLAEWRAAGPCPESPCLRRIRATRGPSNSHPELYVSGEVEVKVEITAEEFDQAFDSVARAIASHGMAHRGCSSEAPEEWLYSFAGDHGEGVPIQGCDTDVVETARRTLRAIALRHLP